MDFSIKRAAGPVFFDGKLQGDRCSQQNMEVSQKNGVSKMDGLLWKIYENLTIVDDWGVPPFQDMT